MTKKEFITNFITTFIATWEANHYQENCHNGWGDNKSDPPFEDLVALAEENWKKMWEVGDEITNYLEG